MTIQFNTDKNISGHQEFANESTERIAKKLKRFEDHITRIEVHLSDENGHKNSENDIRCLMEARMEGRQPITVTHDANTKQQALSGATDKLKAALDTVVGKMAKR